MLPNKYFTQIWLGLKRVQYCKYSSEGGSICGTLSCEDTEGTGDVKITKNISQIEALIKRINDENKKTKEVLEKIDR